MPWGPTPSELVVIEATPAPSRVPVPSVVAPSVKVTTPVGTGPAGTAATVAVKVTDSPTTDVAAPATTPTDAPAAPTSWATVPLEVRSSGSPP